jgi:hypothetical protein
VGVGLEIADEMSEAAGRAKNWSLIISPKKNYKDTTAEAVSDKTMKIEEVPPRKKKKYEA